MIINKEIYAKIIKLSNEPQVLKIANDVYLFVSEYKIDLDSHFADANVICAIINDYRKNGGTSSDSDFVIKEAVKLAIENRI